MRKIFSISILALAIGFILPERTKVTIFLAGDSTMSIKDIKAYPETGWGMPFVNFWDSTVKVVNRARNGRSTKTFISEGLWKSTMDEARAGDYVFIQFGHNDEAVEKKERYATPEEYKANLVKFIKETKALKAYPILLTPVTRRKFDKEGRIMETHEAYSKLVREVAAGEQVPLIDLDTKSRDLLQEFGEQNSKLLFLQLKPGEHPNYPEGKNDNTHFNELGARLMAQIVLKEIKELKLELADRIVRREVK